MQTQTTVPLDFAILKYIADKHRGAWKARIHDHIAEDYQEYPFVAGVAAQTIGRHVDKLVKKGHLSPCFVSPDDVDQTFVTGFTVTEAGREAMEKARTELLEERIVPDAARSADAVDVEQIGKQALMNLMADEFDLEEEEGRRLMERIELEDLLLFLTLFYARRTMRRASANLADTTVEDMQQLIREAPKLQQEFAKVCGSCKISLNDPNVEQVSGS